jgi:hypothetical protein
MKRLFATIFTVIALCAAYSQTSVLQPVKYCNVGPLAAVNLCIYYLQTIKNNADYFHMLETHAGVIASKEQMQAILKSYNKTPKKLQIMKNKLCKIMGLNPTEVQLKLDKEAGGTSTNTLLNLITIDKGFLRLPYNQQWGILAHELGHIIHNDCKKQIDFDIASSCVVAIGAYAITSPLHVPHMLELHQSVTELAQAAHSRAIEKRADREAMQVPQAAQGLSEYLEDLKDTYEYSTDAFSTHPTHEERIKDLRPFVQEEK